MVAGAKESKPEWLRVKIPDMTACGQVRAVLRERRVRSVCDSSHCPNLGQCWSMRTATFLIMGDSCSRHCRFCAVPWGGMERLDRDEPSRIALAVRDLDLEYVVITSVSRDDLPGMGADHFARCVELVKNGSGANVEVLLPDLNGEQEALERIMSAGPDVVGHNVETVPRLQASVRDRRASFARSLRVLQLVKQLHPGAMTKSSLMLGLGESEDEVRQTLYALRDAGVDILTLGQYLRPGPEQLPVVRYVPPDEFVRWKQEALDMGFGAVMSGPFVRSSYQAKEAFDSLREGNRC